MQIGQHGTAASKNLSQTGGGYAIVECTNRPAPAITATQCSMHVKTTYKKFGLGRIKVREFAMRGEIPGIVKASW